MTQIDVNVIQITAMKWLSREVERLTGVDAEATCKEYLRRAAEFHTASGMAVEKITAYHEAHGRGPDTKTLRSLIAEEDVAMGAAIRKLQEWQEDNTRRRRP